MKKNLLLELESSLSFIGQEFIPNLNRNLFDIEFENLAKSVNHDIDLFNFFFVNYHNALKEARNNNVLNAQNIINRTDKLIRIDSLVGDEQKLFLLVKNPINAYIEYKLGNFRLSEELTISTMVLDDYFQKVNSAIFFHKIQQLQNITRIKLRKNDYASSSKIIGILFSVLILNKKEIFEEISFECDSQIEMHKGLKTLMLSQIFDEWITTLIKLESSERNEYFLNSISNIPLYKKSDSEFYGILVLIDIIVNIICDQYNSSNEVIESINKLVDYPVSFSKENYLELIKKLLS